MTSFSDINQQIFFTIIKKEYMNTFNDGMKKVTKEGFHALTFHKMKRYSLKRLTSMIVHLKHSRGEKVLQNEIKLHFYTISKRDIRNFQHLIFFYIIKFH